MQCRRCLSSLFVALLVGFCADVHPFALSPKEAEDFCLLVPCAAEPVGHVGIKFCYLPRTQDQVMVSENKTHAARQDIQPFVSFVGLKAGFDLGGRDDNFPRLRATGLTGQGNDGTSVRISGLEPDTGVSHFGGADEFIQGYPKRLGQREKQLQAGAALTGLQPGQSALGDSCGCPKARQANTSLHAQASEPPTNLIERGGDHF